MCVLIFFTTFISNISHSKNNSKDIITNEHTSLRKLYIILVRFYWNLNFLKRFSKNTEISNLIRIHPVETEFYADRRNDKHDEDKSGFSQFCT
jgi:hypothetical protein